MVSIRRASERGISNMGWLKSAHTFSFGHYFDPKNMGYGPLRVINDDRVSAGGGFGTHGHKDMEIISYVLSGAMEHKDSIGNGSIMRPGDVQRMSAGTGIRHSEFNHSQTGELHFLQIWFLPDRENHKPGYQQKNFSQEQRQGNLLLVASREGEAGSVSLNQDVRMYSGLFHGNQSANHHFAANRIGWLQVARGQIVGNGTLLQAGDSMAFSGGEELSLSGGVDAEVLVFDMVK